MFIVLVLHPAVQCIKHTVMVHAIYDGLKGATFFPVSSQWLALRKKGKFNRMDNLIA